VKYDIILADPPWKYFDPKGHNPAMGGCTYPTMSNEELCSLPVGEIANDNCALFLWVTMPKLEECFSVINSWGFKFITCAFTWVKLNPKNNGIYSGLGHYTNGNAELCLLCKKGRLHRIQKNVKQVILAPRGKHSHKPPEIRGRIIDLLGNLPRIELFARDKVDGWDSIGYDIDGTDIKESLNKIINDKFPEF
jgi:site-specific DNA-methyltransferase (adenine-specific)